MGLISGHAYSVIAVCEVTGSDGRDARIVQVRNPWGSGEWLGDWSDESTLWTEAAKKKAKMVVADDGTFWMSFDDFAKFFSMVFVSTYMDGYAFNSSKLPILKDGNFGFYLIQMNVPAAGEYTIAISQKDRRCFPLSTTYNYGHTTVSVIKDNQGNLEYLKGDKTWNRDAYVPFDKL
jgi:calpain-15